MSISDADDQQVAQLRAFNSASEASANQVSALEERIDAITQEHVKLNVELESLTTDLSFQWPYLIAAEAEFKAEVEEKAACSFIDVIKAASAIIGMVSGARSALMALGALDEFKPPSKDDRWAEAKYQIKTLKEAKGSIDDVSRQYGKLRDVLDDGLPDFPDLPSDAGKIQMQKDEFDRLMVPFSEISAAHQYREMFHRYIDLTQARNNLIAEYNSLLAMEQQVREGITTAQSEIDRLTNAVVQTRKAHLPEFKSFMARALLGAKTELVRVLHEQNRALEFWSGEQHSFLISRETVRHLQETHENLQKQLLRILKYQGRSPQEFRFEDPVGLFTLSDLAGNDAVETFKAHGRALLEIPAERFIGLLLLRASEVRARFPGIRKGESYPHYPEYVPIRLVHTGVSYVTNLNHEIKRYQHDSRVTTLFIEFHDKWSRPYNLGGSDEFAKIPPSGIWRLEIDLERFPHVDMEHLEDIEIQFAGEFVSN